jgi:hypothetical protein
MKRIVVGAAALAALLAAGLLESAAVAQGQKSMPGKHMAPSSGPELYGDEFSGGWSTGDYGGGSCSSCDSGSYGSCGVGGCGEYGCCDDCNYGCDAGASGCNCLGGQPRWYAFADYLYVRASFSEAVAYIEQDTTNLDDQRDFVHELDFQYESSYRFGGGYRLNCCDEELRFTFTRLSSGASTVAPAGSLVPYEVIGPGDSFITADVDVKALDLDYRKTIPLGGPACCECGDCCDPCGDPCGCGDTCCSPGCPAWDITWSGGLRLADVNWDRYYLAPDDGEVFRSARPTLNFSGGGPRFGLEGRRYFGQSRWCSAFIKGDISLLVGQMEQKIVRIDEDGFRSTLTARGRRIIPVTEIEAGLSSQLTSSSRVSAGYLFSAWHDLGFRDQFDIQTLVESNSTDTANILGFDGLFVRFEVGY